MPRKGENIYKRADGRWEARYIHHYENGKAKYRYIYGASYSEAKAKRQAELSMPENMRISSVKELATLEDISALWLRNKKNSVKESTYTRYVRTVKKNIIPGFDVQRLQKIDGTVINLFYEKLTNTLSDKTVSDIMCVFRSIWNYGIENGYPCCCRKLPKTKVKKNNEIAVIPPESRKVIETALFAHNNLVSLGIIFTLFTGVRIGEICGLRWGDIDFDNGYAYIRRTVERIADLDSASVKKTKVIVSEPKTDNSVRIIPLPGFLVEYIKDFRANDDKYVLTASTKHTEPHTYYMRYKNYLRKHNLGNYTFHELRHTFATECVDRGFDIKSLSEILGHADVSTTMNYYVHPTLQMKKRQMEMLTRTSCSPSK